MGKMRIFHPAPKDMISRDALLLKALREEGSPFPIAAEYPIVLAPEATGTSYVLEDDGRMAAHASLWPREVFLKDRGRLRVGLVGNVATAGESRGKGLMRALFERLCDEARKQNLAALILWSDLRDFYKKMGFEPWGRELRLTYRTKDLPFGAARISRAPDPSVLLSRRFPHLPTLDRSPDEFARLLTIPGMALFEWEGGYVLTGKGCDMQGVVHEWGAADVAGLLAGVRAVGEALQIESVMLLAPGKIPDAWRRALTKPADHVEEHAMAWLWSEDPKAKQVLADLFVWGLDSI